MGDTADEILPDDGPELEALARSEEAAINALALDLIARDSAKAFLAELEDAALKYGLPIVQKAAPIVMQLLIASL